MNILIPDSWLREHLETSATPKQLKDCLSLCGPSIERINTVGDEVVYDIEVTTNRIDMMSVRGIAREAAVILPEFDINATLLPYPAKQHLQAPDTPLDITFKHNKDLCNRILAIKISDVTIGESPLWLKRRLELVGQRSLNNLIDITNYVMWEVGHPIHVFDYDRLTEKHITVRLAKQGEKIVTLDNKIHTLRGGEIVLDDGKGTIIDLPGIMGTANTVATDKTKHALFFSESCDPALIRKASMSLSIRTQAAIINEKYPDHHLAPIAIKRAVEMAETLTGGTQASTLYDFNETSNTVKQIHVSQTLIDQYIGTHTEPKRITSILERLGCDVSSTQKKETMMFTVTPPTLRNDDMTIPEDVVEEVARIIGYHTITPRLPSNEPPPVVSDTALSWEEDVKIRLRDWGYTEIYGYSMISEYDLSQMHTSKDDVYTITNPLSQDHVYLRPLLLPSMLHTISEQYTKEETISLFELSHTYQKQEKNLPLEKSELLLAMIGQHFFQLKGIAESLFALMGIPFPQRTDHAQESWYKQAQSLQLGQYGAIGLLQNELLMAYNIKKPVTVLSLSFETMVADSNPHYAYIPAPKHPPIIEDYSFTFPSSQHIGPVLEALRQLDPNIHTVKLIDMYKNNRTIRISFLHPEKTLRVEDIQPLREHIIQIAKETFKAALVGEDEQ